MKKLMTDRMRELIAAILLIAVSTACFGTFLIMQILGPKFNTYEPNLGILVLEIVLVGLVSIFAVWNLIKVMKASKIGRRH